jgi:hypothetical protein
MCEGGHFSMFPTAAVKLFGIQNGGYIFTIMFFAVPTSAMVGFLIDYFGKSYISFEAVFLIGSFLTALNMILLYIYKDEEMISQKTLDIRKIQE